MLSEKELERYDRQLRLNGFGKKGQERLKKAKVFIAGCGGLGSVIAIYLAVAGVGKIRIVDRDRVELSNLNHQILHWDTDIGKKKVESAKRKLKWLNPNIKIETSAKEIIETNILELIADCDLVLDALDNYPTRYFLNKAALIKGIPFIHGSIYGFEGMVTTVIPGRTACLRCLFSQPPPPATFPAIGVAPAVIGSIQATEAIKLIVGIGKLLTNRLLIFDGSQSRFKEFNLKRDPHCPDCSQIA